MGDTGVLVPPQDEQTLADGLLTLLALSTEQRQQQGQRAKERVFSEFGIEKARARFDAVYQEVITGK